MSSEELNSFTEEIPKKKKMRLMGDSVAKALAVQAW